MQHAELPSTCHCCDQYINGLHVLHVQQEFYLTRQPTCGWLVNTVSACLLTASKNAMYQALTCLWIVFSIMYLLVLRKSARMFDTIHSSAGGWFVKMMSAHLLTHCKDAGISHSPACGCFLTPVSACVLTVIPVNPWQTQKHSRQMT